MGFSDYLFNLFFPQYKFCFDYSINVCCIIDEDFNFTRVNNTFVNIIGNSPIMFLDIISPVDWEHTLKSLGRLNDNVSVEFTNRIMNSTGGNIKYLSWKAWKINKKIVLMANDISDIYIKEERIKHLEIENKKYSDIFSNVVNVLNE